MRGISGFGQSGKIHTANLLDVSLDLPLIVEFFDEVEKIQTILVQVEKLISPDHIVQWPASLPSSPS